MRATSLPAAIMSLRVASESDAGPMVATIFVRRAMPTRYLARGPPPVRVPESVDAGTLPRRAAAADPPRPAGAPRGDRGPGRSAALRDRRRAGRPVGDVAGRGAHRRA